MTKRPSAVEKLPQKVFLLLGRINQFKPGVDTSVISDNNF